MTTNMITRRQQQIRQAMMAYFAGPVIPSKNVPIISAKPVFSDFKPPDEAAWRELKTSLSEIAEVRDSVTAEAVSCATIL